MNILHFVLLTITRVEPKQLLWEQSEAEQHTESEQVHSPDMTTKEDEESASGGNSEEGYNLPTEADEKSLEVTFY